MGDRRREKEKTVRAAEREERRVNQTDDPHVSDGEKKKHSGDY